jgi:CBS domain containing-hemolysin-like protein
MASIVYTALLFVFIFGATFTFINDTKLYEQQMPDSGLQSNLEEVNKTSLLLLQEAEHPSAFSTWGMLGIMAHSILGGMVGLFTFGYFLEQMGLPSGLVGYLLSPLAIVFLFWLAEYFLGRPAE